MSNTSTSRSLPTAALLSAILAAAVLAGVSVPSVAHAGDDEKCTLKLKNDKVKEACAKGGRKQAKDLMKGAAKKGGVKCNACHENQKDFKLKDEEKAEKKLKELLAD